MFKKMILILTASACMMQPVCMAADVQTVVAPIIESSDAKVISDNLSQISSNMCTIGENSARVFVRSFVALTGALATTTKFCSEHPNFTFLGTILGAYGLYQWHQAKDAARKKYQRHDVTLLEVLRTTTELWGRLR
jgi:hypothetical protein